MAVRTHEKGKIRDQNDLSRVVGTMWRNMTREQRAPWVFMADEEKRKHAALYPGYKSDVEVPAAVRVDADRTLSSYTIEPPGGTSSWGQEASPPSVYVPDTSSSSAYQHYDHFNTPPLIYTEQGNSVAPQRRQQFNLNYEEYWAPEIPRFQPPTPNESVPSIVVAGSSQWTTRRSRNSTMCEGNYINQWSSEPVPSSSEISPSSSVESTEYYALYSGSTSTHYWAPVIPQQQPSSSPTGYDPASAADNPPSTGTVVSPQGPYDYQGNFISEFGNIPIHSPSAEYGLNYTSRVNIVARESSVRSTCEAYDEGYAVSVRTTN
ncbi:hypothetical protein C8R46DRAFT_1342146 [Mycena filopes]|nr:hypothetical protein C8R46DRAFT_1342146 [Mycena filopes]